MDTQAIIAICGTITAVFTTLSTVWLHHQINKNTCGDKSCLDCLKAQGIDVKTTPIPDPPTPDAL